MHIWPIESAGPYFYLGPKVAIVSVGVLDRQTYQGVPEVVDCAVGIVIG
jgi:hypothetical protein